MVASVESYGKSRTKGSGLENWRVKSKYELFGLKSTKDNLGRPFILENFLISGVLFARKKSLLRKFPHNSGMDLLPFTLSNDRKKRRSGTP